MAKNEKTGVRNQKREKMKEYEWAGVPGEGTNSSWDIFLACGGVLNYAVSNLSLNNSQSYWYRTMLNVLDIEMTNSTPGSEHLISSIQGNINDAGQCSNCLSQALKSSIEGQDSDINQKDIIAGTHLAVKILSSNPREAFPFLVFTRCFSPPLPAIFITAMLCARYIFNGEAGPVSRMRELLTILNEPPHEWELIGKSLTAYSQRKESLIKMNLDEEDVSALDCSLVLSKIAYKRLLNIEPPEHLEYQMGFPSVQSQLSSSIRTLRRRLHSARTPDTSSEDEQKIEYCELSHPKVCLDDLVLSDSAKMDLQLIAQMCGHREDSAPTMLFYGPPGTGKTHAASALSGEIGRTLATANIAKITSRFVGQTEKHLEDVFKEAKDSNSILLLDESDSLLYTRTESSRSWELTQVNTLLKLLEKPSIPVILCTNFIDKLDTAVHRRIQYIISFDIPEFEERKAIWERELRLARVRARLDLNAIAEVPLTGGLIANVATKVKSFRDLLGRKYRICTDKLIELAVREAGKMGGTEYGMKRTIGFTA